MTSSTSVPVSAPIPVQEVSEDGSRQILDQLVRQGYLTTLSNVNDDDSKHMSRSPPPPSSLLSSLLSSSSSVDDVDNDDSMDAFRRWQQQQHRQLQSSSTSSTFSPSSSTSPNGPLIATLNGDCYYTHKGLANALLEQLGLKDDSEGDDDDGDDDDEGHHHMGGRASLPDLCRRLNIHTLGSLDSNSNTVNDGSCIRFHLEAAGVIAVSMGGHLELFSPTYWDRLANREISKQLQDGVGSLSILDFSRRHNIPLELLQSRILSRDHLRTWTTVLEDSQRLVTNHYIEELKRDAVEYFASLEEPIHLTKACQQHERWDLTLLTTWMSHDTRFLEACHGTVHVDVATIGSLGGANGGGGASGANGGASGGGIFVPTIYQQNQQSQILDYVSANGYITGERAAQIQGVSVSEMIAIVRKEYQSSAKVVQTTMDDDAAGSGVVVVVVLDWILQALEVAIEEYLVSPTTGSMTTAESLDLQEYLAPDLMQSPDLVSKLLAEAGFTDSLMAEKGGVAILVKDQAIVIRHDVVRHIHDHTISRLIETFAKVRAQELFNASCLLDHHNEDDALHDDDHHGGADKKSGKSSKSKGKRGCQKTDKHKSSLTKKTTVATGIVPLCQVAEAILHDYPSLLPEQIVDSCDVMTWGDIDWEVGTSDDDDEGKSETNNLLCAFCQQALYTDSFRSECEKSVMAELSRLQSEKKSKSSLSRKDAAAKVRSVEAAFEDAFVTLCHLIQAQAKFNTYFVSSSSPTNNEEYEDKEKAITILNEELLRGPCADFTSRITQNALFKEENDRLFTFVPTTENEESPAGGNPLPPFCTDVDIAARHFSATYLSYPPPRDPLPILRESLSGNTGVVLSRQWILCGGHCYRGGVVRMSDDCGSGDSQDELSSHVRPGNLEGFLSHVEDNCLTLCGLPFKKLDKKTEKQLLFSRKQRLTNLLLQTPTTDAVAVLEYTIMILFQQVKQLVVCGSLLRSSILRALVQERKVPSAVGQTLIKLEERIEKGDLNEELVSMVKEFGLCRDISKYNTSSLEAGLEKI